MAVTITEKEITIRTVPVGEQIAFAPSPVWPACVRVTMRGENGTQVHGSFILADLERAVQAAHMLLDR